MGISAKDRQYMHEALELAAKGKGRTSPNPMVGAVLVKDDVTVGRGTHMGPGLPHAEKLAIAEAGQAAKGATLYVNLEPCSHFGRTPPCTQSILEAGITRVVAAMVDPNPLVAGKGLRKLRSDGVEVDCGVLEGFARRLNAGFLMYHLKKRPFVLAKWAMTLDGRTSADSGDSRWISNDKSRRYVHELRSNVDAIAVGVGTVFFDNPRLNVRLEDYQQRQPRRIIFDGRLRTPTAARCLEPGGGETILIATEGAPPERVETFRKAGHKVIVLPGKSRVVNTDQALRQLAEEEGIQTLLVEGGRQLHTSMIREKLVDKVIVFIAPHLVGGRHLTVPTRDLGIFNVKKGFVLKNIEIKTFDTDMCMEGYINRLPQVKESQFF